MEFIVYLQHVRSALAVLSDKERQLRDWCGDDAPPFASPMETLCTLFDDSSLGDALEHGVVFSAEIDDRFRALDQLVREDLLSLPIADLLESEDWSTVADIAAGLAKELSSQPYAEMSSFTVSST